MLTTLEEISARLIDAYGPDRIILFGSRALDEGGDESDIDLLIVKETNLRAIDRRVEVEKILIDRKVPLDIFVYTPAEMRYLYSVGSPFVEEVMETGKVLYMRKVTDSWIKDAEDELASAAILRERERFKGACYHSQQCVEKCLKALVMEKGQKFTKVHDIVELLAHAKRVGWEISLPMDDAVFLNSIYKGRYLTEEGLLPFGDPSREDAEKAVAAAEGVMRAASALLATA